MRVLIMNGPPGCGKDTLAKEMVSLYNDVFGLNAQRFEFKQYVKAALYHYFELTEDEIAYFEANYDDRNFKENPWPPFGGMSPREALIYVSEVIEKPAHGEDVFGQMALRNLIKRESEGLAVAVFSDGGFHEEFKPIANTFRTYNFALYGRGDWGKDSRYWLDPSVVYSCKYGFSRKIVLEDGNIIKAVTDILKGL